MSKQRTEKSPFQSPSTNEGCTAAQYLAEIICTRKAKKSGKGDLSYKFWNKENHKKEYQGVVTVTAKLIKKYGEGPVLHYFNNDGKYIYWIGFFRPFDWVVKGIEKTISILDKQNMLLSIKLEEERLALEKEAEENKIVVEIPKRPESNKKVSIFSKLKEIDNG